MWSSCSPTVGPTCSVWQTALLDEAALIFGGAFAESIAHGHPPPRAYDAACQAIATVTEPGRLDTGMPSAVQKYELHVDPSDTKLVHPALPLTLHSGRLLKYAPQAGRGRLAVGVPRLLIPGKA